MTYRLTYWNKRGRGEQIRLLLSDLGEPWEDVFVAGKSFVELKRQGPGVLAFGSVPMLEDGDLRLCQGPVILGYLARKHGVAPDGLAARARADMLALGAEDLRMKYFTLFGQDAAGAQAAFVQGDWASRWLPSFEGHLALNGDTGYLVGSALTHADVAVWDALDAVLAWVDGASLAGHPRLERFYDAIRQRPGIAAYLSSGRRPTS